MPTRTRTARLFEELLGDWTLDRVVQGYGTMSGLARFSSESLGTLRYREDGEMRLHSGASLPAYREFLYRLEEDAIIIKLVDGPTAGAVLFRLEPVFESCEPWPAAAEAVHPCRADLYRGRYAFESPGLFRTEISIEGPEKSAKIQTSFRRKLCSEPHDRQGDTSSALKYPR